ncbi:hypothetical protein EK904_003290 [Melospiza melodia maxima]|nr:hypothetical protein EK904_003290 [Melospiza melodia maxima]
MGYWTLFPNCFLWAGVLQTPWPVLEVNSRLPHALFLRWEHGAAIPAVTLAGGVEAGEISNMEKLQLGC